MQLLLTMLTPAVFEALKMMPGLARVVGSFLIGLIFLQGSYVELLPALGIVGALAIVANIFTSFLILVMGSYVGPELVYALAHVKGGTDS